MTAPRDYCAIAHRYALDMTAAYAAEEAIKAQLRPVLKAIADLRKEEQPAEPELGSYDLGRLETAAEELRQRIYALPVRCNKYVALACQRQLDDLKRKRFAYTFDEARANHPCKFIELLQHTKG